MRQEFLRTIYCMAIFRKELMMWRLCLQSPIIRIHVLYTAYIYIRFIRSCARSKIKRNVFTISLKGSAKLDERDERIKKIQRKIDFSSCQNVHFPAFNDDILSFRFHSK